MREKYLHNRVFPSLDSLVEVLCKAFSVLADDKECLCFLTGFPHLNQSHLSTVLAKLALCGNLQKISGRVPNDFR
jgi:hypothetical protein